MPTRISLTGTVCCAQSERACASISPRSGREGTMRVTVMVCALTLVFAGCSSGGESAACVRLRGTYEQSARKAQAATGNIASISEEDLAASLRAMREAGDALK